MSAPGPSTVLYDADCGFCRWSAERLRRWDRGRHLRFVPLHDAEARTLVPGMSARERASAWHLVAPDGTVVSGGAAVAPVLRLLPGGAPPAALAERFPGVTDRAYRWVAEHRDRIGRILGRRACAVDPGARRS